MSISSIYQIDNFLWKLISSKDGLLGVTVAWLLKKRKINYVHSLFVEETELDFICETPEGKVLLECKTHRAPRTNRSVRQELINDFKQIKNHRKKFEDKNREKIFESYLVYNYDLSEYSDIVNEETRNYENTYAIDFSELDEVIRSFSSKED